MINVLYLQYCTGNLYGMHFYHVTGPVKMDQVGKQNVTMIFNFIVS